MAGNVSPDGYSVDGMGCAAVDEQLLEHEGHLKYRWDKFMETKKRIEDAEGSLEEFAKGYDKFGFNKKSDGSIVYREWAPAACSAFLIGDFNQWSPESHPMQKDDFGVWEITLPAGTIPHGSRVKIKMRKSTKDGSTASPRGSPTPRRNPSSARTTTACTGTHPRARSTSASTHGPSARHPAASTKRTWA